MAAGETNPFKVTKYKKEWRIFRPKMRIFVLILSLLSKIKTKIHLTNTHNTGALILNKLEFCGKVHLFQ